MYTKQSKKMLPFDVLEILQKYTDVNHRLSQKEIEKILVDKYDMVVDRRSIKRSITDLMDMGLDIQYSEIIRIVKDKQTGEEEEQSIWTDFYLERDFSDCEIRLLIDELLGNKLIPVGQRRQLISKLEGLSSIYFRKRKTLYSVENYDNSNKQFFYTLDVLDEAIATNSKVSFKCKGFRIGKKGRVEEYFDKHTVTPLDTRMVEGEYLLLCIDKDFNEKTYRLDFISDIILEDERGHRRLEKFKDKKSNTLIKLLTTEENILFFVRKFGAQAIFAEADKDRVIMSIKMDENAAIEFGVSHSDIATVIYPENVRFAVMERLRGGYYKYEGIGA